MLKEANDIVLARDEDGRGPRRRDAPTSARAGRRRPIVVDQAKAAAAGVTPVDAQPVHDAGAQRLPARHRADRRPGTLPAQLMVRRDHGAAAPGRRERSCSPQLPVPGADGMVPLGDDRHGRRGQGAGAGHPRRRRSARRASRRPPSNNNIGAASTRRAGRRSTTVELPAGATWELAGATEVTNDVFRTLGIAMLDRHPARLHHHGGDLPQPAEPAHPAGQHPVRRGRRRARSGHHRHQPRHAEPRRPAHAHRHRRDQRHRAARPRGAVPAQGHGRAHAPSSRAAGGACARSS